MGKFSTQVKRKKVEGGLNIREYYSLLGGQMQTCLKILFKY